MTPEFRPLSFGEILDAAFTMYRRTLAVFLATALIPMLAVMVAFALLGGEMFSGLISQDPARILAAMLPGLLISGLFVLGFLVMAAALTRESSRRYLGEPVSVADGLRAGMRALLPLIGVTLLAGIGFIVVTFAFGMVLGILGAATGAGQGGEPGAGFRIAVTLLGMIVYLAGAALLFAVLPAVVIEGKGPVESIARSFDLARGVVARVVGIVIVTFLITYLPGLAVIGVTGGFAQLANPQAVPTPGMFVTQQLLWLAVYVLTTPFFVSVLVLLYYDRRIRTEALDVQMAADRLSAAG